MPLIRISHAATYDDSTKQAVMSAVTNAYAEATGSDASKVWVVIDEVSRADWSAGGVALAERDRAAAK